MKKFLLEIIKCEDPIAIPFYGLILLGLTAIIVISLSDNS